MLKNVVKKIVVSIITLEAKLVLKKYKPKIVSVTGTVGKTSTKDAIYDVLSSNNFVRKSQKSFNSEIGVPLTILGCSNAWNNPFLWIKNIFEGILLLLVKNHYPKILILEIGADTPGDIESIVKWIKSDIVVLTKYADIPSHVEYFDSPQAVIREKQFLPKSLNKNGILITNGDDRLMQAEKMPDVKHIRYGYDKENDVIASNFKPLLSGINFRVDYMDKSVPVKVKGVFGKHHTYPLLAAFSVGVALDINIVSIIEALGNYVPTPGRMRLLKGINKSLIIDDTYNSSPVALSSALNSLKRIKGRKVVILGDMMELGTYSVEAHKKIGKEVEAGLLITVGIRSQKIGEVSKIKNAHHFADSLEAVKEVGDMIEPGDVVLVKGSQSVRMEKIVEAIMLEKDQKESLLVRQDKEWKNR